MPDASNLRPLTGDPELDAAAEALGAGAATAAHPNHLDSGQRVVTQPFNFLPQIPVWDPWA